MLIAQAMGEYGAGMVIAQAIERGRILVGQLRHAEPSTWAMLAFGAFAIWFLVGRSR